MDGDIFRTKAPRCIKAPAEALVIVSRKPGDQIHVDVVKAHRPRHPVAVDHILRGMLPPDPAKHLIRKGLGIDGDAGRSALADRFQFFRCDGIRTPGFDRIFNTADTGEIRTYRPGQLSELRGGKNARRAAAEIDAF